MKRSMMTGAVVVAALMMVSLSQGQTVRTWTGTVDGNWSNSANWAGGTLPPVNDSGSLSTYWEVVYIASGMNPTSNIPLLNGGGTQPFLKVGTGMSVAYTLSDGYDGLNQVRPESMNGTDSVVVEAGGSLTIHPEAAANTITMSRQQNTDVLGTYFVYRVGAGGIMDLAAGRVDFAWNNARLSHLILDGGTFQMTGATQFYGTRNNGGFATNVYSKVTLSNGGTFAGENIFLSNMDPDISPTMIFDITDGGSVVAFKFGGGAFPSMDSVIAARGKTFKSSTFGDDALVFTDHGDSTVSVTAVDPVTTTPFETWLSGYTLGAFTNQLDDAENGGLGDGFNNLMEYALGGDPSVDDAASIMPVSAVDGAMLNYIYTRQNPKDADLIYTVLDGTDLIVGLVNTNTSETVSGVVNGFETVTNQVSTAVEGQQFMKLKVEFGD